MKILWRIGLLFSLSFCLFTASAETWWVSQLGDNGAGSLREQILLAQAGDTIAFDPAVWGDTLSLTSGALNVDKAIVIHGPGAALLTFDNKGLGRHFVFSVTTGFAFLRGLTLTGGTAPAIGGSIRNNANLVVEDCHFTDNSSDRGGAILHSGNLVLRRCTFSENTGMVQGGALFVNAGSVLVDRCTFSGNQSLNGGALYHLGGQLTVASSTLTGNSAFSAGGAFFSLDSMVLISTLMAGNTAATEAQGANRGTLSSLGYNLVSDTANMRLLPATGDLLGDSSNLLDPYLEPLMDPGSGVPVHPLACGSPALDAGNPADSSLDQRGNPVVNSQRDIGAYERDIPPPVLVCPANILVSAPDCDGTTVAYDAPLLPACAGTTLTLLEGFGPGATYPSGETEVRYEMTQSYGDTQTCSFTITVQDGEAPEFFGGGDTFQETTLLQAPGISPGDQLGHKLSASGLYAIAGAPGNDSKGSGSGAAAIFRQAAGGWVTDTLLLASDGSDNDSFGQSVAISGNRVLVGAQRESRLGFFEAGAVYAFERNSSGRWSQTQKIIVPGAGSYDWLGYAVALDGDQACMTAPRDDDAGFDAGAVYLLTRGSTNWVGSQKLVASDGSSGDWFGRAVALEGNRLVVGAHLEGSDDRGAAYVFRKDGSVWSEEARLQPATLGSGENFGWSVALNEGRIAIGALLADPDGKANAGAIYTYERDSAGLWTLRQKLVPAAAAPGDFTGISVAMNGNQLLAGAYGADLDGSVSGTAIRYVYSGGMWLEQESLRGSAAAGQQNGWSVALTEGQALVGATQASLAGSAGGLIRFFQESSLCGTVLTYPSDSLTCSRLVEYPLPQTRDNCTILSFALSAGLGSGSMYPVGETVDRYEARDAGGLVSTCAITIRIQDNQPPVALCDSLVLALPSDSSISVTALDLDGGSFDACGGPLTFALTGDSLSFGCPDLGQTRLLTLVVSDTAGNSSSCQAAVTLVNPYPVLTDSLLLALDPSEFGAADGQLEVQLSGGLPPYFLLWSTGDTTTAISGLEAGTYTLTAYDAQCQMLTAEYTLTNPIPVCNQTVEPTNLRTQFVSNGMVLRWDAVPASLACRVKGKLLFSPGGFSELPPVFGDEPDSAFISKSVLFAGFFYIWRVQCACRFAPLVTTKFSELDTFLVPFGREIDPLASLQLWPIPATHHLNWSLNNSETGEATVRVLDATGRQHNIYNVMFQAGPETGQLDISSLAAGFYLLDIRQRERSWQKAFTIHK
ncbi:MAG: HYR domain-containing protein [Bacteroidetes bacterium]|nr:HYR domain-containing protein [Bacteroidota bacterium]